MRNYTPPTQPRCAALTNKNVAELGGTAWLFIDAVSEFNEAKMSAKPPPMKYIYLTLITSV